MFRRANCRYKFLYNWATILICEIYPYVGNPSAASKQEMEKSLFVESDRVASFFKTNVDPVFYPLLRPLFALIVLIVLNRTNILTESNAGHHSAELMNRALIPFFETDILNIKEYQYLYIGRLCAILDSFVGRTYKLNNSEKETVKLYYKKLQKAIDCYPPDLPDHNQYRSLGEQCMMNVNKNVLDLSQNATTSLTFNEEINISNALQALEFGKHEKVFLYVNKRFSELSSIKSLTMGEVEELISMTEIFSKLKDHVQALQSFKIGEKSFFDVLGRLLQKNAIKLDQCPTTIAIFRQLIFNNVILLQDDPVMYSNVAFRWKCLFTHVRALIINLGLKGSISDFFINYIDSLTSSPNDPDSVMTISLADQMKKEEVLLSTVANQALETAYSCNYDNIVQSLDSHSILIDYVFFVTMESDPSLMKATCIIAQEGNDPVVCELDYDKIRHQTAMVIDVMTKERKIYWNKLEAKNEDRIYFELKILSDVLLPDVLKKKLLSDKITHLYVCLEGDLALIPFTMLPIGDDDKTLNEYVTVSLLGSVHQLKSHEYTIEHEKVCYVVADPNFNCCLPAKPASFFTTITSKLSQYLNISEPSGTILEQLGDPAISEADFISYTLCSRGFKVQQWLSDDANLKNMMSLRNPLLLHICTHAYTDASRTVSRGNFFADLSSGLALAGFNIVSKQLYDQINPECSLGKFPSLAVLSLDLRCTKLVYLSTCDSASGMITTQEELVSLSSSFLAAGAETVVATLWRVNNNAAADFSKYFYDHLLSANARPSQALAYARKKLSDDPILNHWSHWGAYVCYGSDKPLI